MTRTYNFTSPIGRVDCRLADGETLSLPVVPGILKHPRRAELFEMLTTEAVARKYTRRALEVAAWQVLKQFPRGWLIDCLEEARLRAGRLRALRFLLGLDPEVARDGLNADTLSGPGVGPDDQGPKPSSRDS